MLGYSLPIGRAACLLAPCSALSTPAVRVWAPAVALLTRCCSPAAAARLLPHADTYTRHGFVEVLEADEWAEGAGDSLRQAKEGILQLLHQTLPYAAPNFAHFLLGYQLSEDVSRSCLNEPGAGGFPLTCLHSILDLLDQHIAPPNNEDRQATDLIESCYRLVHQLCARPATAPPALRFLRTREHFLCRHLQATVNLENATPATLSSRSWVLRACAHEAGAAARDHSALATLLRATHQPHQDPPPPRTSRTRYRVLCDSMTRPRHAPAAPGPAPATLLRATHQPQQEWERCLLRRALLGLPVVVAPAPEPRWELFHATQLRAALAQCDVTTGMGGKRISVSRVHALLARELLALHATPAMRTLVSMEIQKVLDYVTEVNRRRNLAATVTHYYDSWRQLTEILFCVAPNDLLDVEAKKNLILNILQDLLNKIPPAEVLPQLGNLASGTVLLLLVNLRHCYIMQKRESSLKSTDFESTFFGPSNQIMQTKSLTLKFILQKILSWIIVSSGSTPKMRVNLYGALLNYLNIVNLKTSPAESYDPLDANETYVSRLDNSIGLPSREESTLKSMVIDVMNEFGDNLCSIVCNDCVAGGHDVCRMVALSCLETLAELCPQSECARTLTGQGYLRSLVDSLLQDDAGLQQTLAELCPQSECARTLTGQGYLRSLVDSLLQDDAGLQQALEPNPKSLRVLYVYESKMALIIKLAHSGAGAAGALCGGALACLAQLKALDCHPDVHMPSSNTHSFLPSAADR
ncbi:unnamed protein product [Plutella xylostella]|uniref:(diamondback moth) hypothetical protein n=1 Tax=Plutella xylostella TaxID=51655 RepID=A0A8S4G1J4_PLUXY|nr:unnamed protein product [Plutella xylostella]